jgi:hypothetical protein
MKPEVVKIGLIRLSVIVLGIAGTTAFSLPVSANAEEKITVTLKNGSLVSGRLIDQLPNGYLVETGNGNVIVDYAQVARVVGLASQAGTAAPRTELKPDKPSPNPIGVVLAVGPRFAHTGLTPTFKHSRNYDIGDVGEEDRQSTGSSAMNYGGLDLEVGYITGMFIAHARFGYATLLDGDHEDSSPLFEVAGGVGVMFNYGIYIGGEIAFTHVNADDLSMTTKTLSDGKQFSSNTDPLYDCSGFLVQPGFRAGVAIPVIGNFTISPELRAGLIATTFDYTQEGFYAVEGEGTDAGEGGNTFGWTSGLTISARWFL